MTERLLISQEDGIAILTLNQPELRNPITDADMVEDMRCSRGRGVSR